MHDNILKNMNACVAEGVFFSGLSQCLRFLLQIFNVVFFSHFISPYYHGIFAIAMFIINSSEIIRDFGFSSAAVQSDDFSFLKMSNLFWLNLLIGFFLSICVSLSSYQLEKIYHINGFHSIVCILSLLFIMNGAATQYRAFLIRHFKYREIVGSDFISQIVGLVIAFSLIILHQGIWALVFQQIFQSLLNLLAIFFFSQWRPKRYCFKTQMNLLIKYGWKLTVSEILNFFSKNFAQLLLGLKFGPAVLAIYNRAFQLIAVPMNQLSEPVLTITMPILSRLQNDDRSFNNFLFQAQTILGHFTVFIYFFSFVHAKQIIHLTLGGQWMSCDRVFQMLSLAGIFHFFSFSSYLTFLSKNMLSRHLMNTVICRSVQILCVFIGTKYGVFGCAAGYLFGMFIQWLFSFFSVISIPSYPCRKILTSHLRLCFIYGCCMVFSYEISKPFLSDIAHLSFGVLGFVLTLFVFFLISKSLRNELKLFYNFIRSIKLSKQPLHQI